MTDYKNVLAFQPLLTQGVISHVDNLLTKETSRKVLQSRKNYYRKQGNMHKALEYAIALEIHTFVEETL